MSESVSESVSSRSVSRSGSSFATAVCYDRQYSFLGRSRGNGSEVKTDGKWDEKGFRTKNEAAGGPKDENFRKKLK